MHSDNFIFDGIAISSKAEKQDLKTFLEMASKNENIGIDSRYRKKVREFVKLVLKRLDKPIPTDKELAHRIKNLVCPGCRFHGDSPPTKYVVTASGLFCKECWGNLGSIYENFGVDHGW